MTAGLAASLASLLVMTACASPSTTELPSGGSTANGSDFTADSGRLAVFAPDNWDEATSEVDPGDGTYVVEAVWVLDGTLKVDATTIIITSYPGYPGSTDQMLIAEREAAVGLLPDSEIVDGADFTTDAGVTFRRLDITDELPEFSYRGVALVTVVDGVGYEIAITMRAETLNLLPDALAGLKTLRFL